MKANLSLSWNWNFFYFCQTKCMWQRERISKLMSQAVTQNCNGLGLAKNKLGLSCTKLRSPFSQLHISIIQNLAATAAKLSKISSPRWVELVINLIYPTTHQPTHPPPPSPGNNAGQNSTNVQFLTSVKLAPSCGLASSKLIGSQQKLC